MGSDPPAMAFYNSEKKTFVVTSRVSPGIRHVNIHESTTWAGLETAPISPCLPIDEHYNESDGAWTDVNYGLPVFPYHSAGYIGFFWRYQTGQHTPGSCAALDCHPDPKNFSISGCSWSNAMHHTESKDGMTCHSGNITSELAWSDNGWNFSRVDGTHRFFDNVFNMSADGTGGPSCGGPPPTGRYRSGHCGGMVYPSTLVETVDGKGLLVHASASARLHGDKSGFKTDHTNVSSLLTFGLRLDGFVALTPRPRRLAAAAGGGSARRKSQNSASTDHASAGDGGADDVVGVMRTKPVTLAAGAGELAVNIDCGQVCRYEVSVCVLPYMYSRIVA